MGILCDVHGDWLSSVRISDVLVFQSLGGPISCWANRLIVTVGPVGLVAQISLVVTTLSRKLTYVICPPPPTFGVNRVGANV